MVHRMAKMLTTSEAGKRLGISAVRVRQLIAASRLPATMIGRDYIIDASDLAKVRNRKPGRPRKSK
jgi:excisionase family DNA binding protein